MMCRFLALMLCAMSLAGPATPASATTVVHLSDQALVESAELILIGDALEVTTTRVDGDGVTLVTVEVAEVFKGETVGSVEVALPGGVDLSGPVPVAVTWPGAPSFARGERAVLFLESYGPVVGAFAISGWSQGKFTVSHDAAGVAEVYRDLSGVTLASPNSHGTAGPRAESLDAFKARIVELVADLEEGP